MPRRTGPGRRARYEPPQQRLVKQIARERFVGAFAGQDDRDVLLRASRELVHRNDDRIADRLVEVPDDLRQQLDVCGPACDLRVDAAQMPSRRGSLLQFVVLEVEARP